MAILLLFITGFLATYVLLRCLLAFTQDANEPPAVETTIPFLSPIIGMRKKSQYHLDLRNKFNFPIHTLRIPFMRLYIINSTDLIPVAQRHYRILDFAPLQAKTAINVMGATPAGKKVIIKNVDGRDDFTYPIMFSKSIHPAISPGAGLDALNRASIQQLMVTLERFNSAVENRISLKLFEWVREEITMATTNGVYGPKNPFLDPKVKEAYWNFEPGVIPLLLNIFPNITARSALAARRTIVAAFDTYFSQDYHLQGSAFVQAHYNHKVKYGATGIDIAHFEIGGMFAALSNTVPSAFWLLWHTISSPDILSKCREEAMACCTISDETVSLDVSKVRQSCPLLLSIFKECLRFHGIGTSVRVVMEDHLLDGKYLLKKGGVVMIPASVQHTSTAAYGLDVDVFKHHRFLRMPGVKLPNATAFRGFGGGNTLCPGRHFVSTEVMVFVALVIAKFDFFPVTGQWKMPGTKQAGAHGTIAPPDPGNEVEVRVQYRDGVAGKKWAAVFEQQAVGVDLVVEDES